jgi:hypothetical protein
MALARIISRSHQCSRELALDLLARGYAVEIVSPDAIPDNLADLELRLEADNASQLSASVEAHSGVHAASLEFIHHLKAPMGDFIRRPPQANPSALVPAQPIAFNAEPGITGDVSLPSENWQVPEAARPKPETLPEVEESARLIAPAEQLPTPAKETAKQAGRSLTLRFQRPELKPTKAPGSEASAPLIRRGEQVLEAAKESAKDVSRSLALRIHRFEFPKARIRRSELKHMKARSEEWLWQAGVTMTAVLSEKRFWRIGVASAAVILMALVLGRGIRRSDAASANPSAQTRPAEKSAPSEATLPTSREPNPESAPSDASATGGKAKSAQASAKPATPAAHHTSGKSGAVRARNKEEDLVARDTVVYFDKSAAVSAAKNSRHRASSNK